MEYLGGPEDNGLGDWFQNWLQRQQGVPAPGAAPAGPPAAAQGGGAVRPYTFNGQVGWDSPVPAENFSRTSGYLNPPTIEGTLAGLPGALLRRNPYTAAIGSMLESTPAETGELPPQYWPRPGGPPGGPSGPVSGPPGGPSAPAAPTVITPRMTGAGLRTGPLIGNQARMPVDNAGNPIAPPATMPARPMSGPAGSLAPGALAGYANMPWPAGQAAAPAGNPSATPRPVQQTRTPMPPRRQRAAAQAVPNLGYYRPSTGNAQAATWVPYTDPNDPRIYRGT